MSGFKSDQQRKWFFANHGVSSPGGGGGGDSSVGFPSIGADEQYRLNSQRNDDRIYGASYDDIREGRHASPDAIAAYFRSADLELLTKGKGGV